MTQVVRYERRDGVGIITVDNPPVNALSKAVRQGLVDALMQGLGDGEAKALVVIGAGRTFIAGADIKEFGKPLEPPDLNLVISGLETAGKPPSPPSTARRWAAASKWRWAATTASRWRRRKWACPR